MQHELIELFEKKERTLEDYQIMARMIDTLGLFSPNETVEDVTTNTLRFMLVPWLHFKALQATQVPREERPAHLTLLKEHLAVFCELLNAYSLDYPSLAKGDAMLRRQQRIAMHREKQEMEKFIELTKQSAEDEEVQRQHWLTCIKLAAIEAREEEDSLEAELSLLSKSPDSLKSPVSDKPVTKVTKPFVLVSDRQRLKDQVFRPDYNLPTMTIDEYLEIEKSRFIQGNEQEVDKEEMWERQDPEAMAWQEAELHRLRSFDQFKDDHAKGSGNTYRRS